MKTHIYLTLKYWRKHKKNAAALMFAGVLLTAVVFVTMMLYREKFVRLCHQWFDARGHYDLMIVNSDDELISEILNGEKGYRDDYNYSFINVYGKLGTDTDKFTYGTINDEHNLMHILLDEGRMPETDAEITISSKVLNKFFWVGKCGDTITLEGKTYTVVGIINEEYYDDNRQGVDEELYKWFFGDDYGVYATPYRLPSIFVGQCDKEPLYRIDLFNNFWKTSYAVNYTEGLASITESTEYGEYIHELLMNRPLWYDFNSEKNIHKRYFDNSVEDSFFLVIAWFGAAIAVLSVYSILKSVFAQRRDRIETLKNIGMSKRSVGCMLAAECAAFTLIQTVIGIVLGLGAYGGIFWFKTSVLREKPYSAFTDIRRVYTETFDPFLSAFVISAAIMVTAYLINALTSKVRKKTPKKSAKPRSLSRSLGKVFRQSGVSVVQTIALTLICFSVIMGYMYTTDNGKTWAEHSGYFPPTTEYYAGSIEMTENNIEEYYSYTAPAVTLIGHTDKDPYQHFPSVDITRMTGGVGDDIDAQLPDCAVATGELTHTFIASGEPKGYGKEIDLSNELVRDSIVGNSSEEYKDLFDEGNLGSGHLYRVDTKLTPARIIETLSEYVRDGGINIDAINSGEEILITYKGKKPYLKAGDTVTVCSSAATANGWGIGELNTAEVKIGAVLQISPDVGEVMFHALRNDQQYNFLTTATGAEALGMHCARYTEIYSSEPMNGGIIPSYAKMTMQSLTQMKWESVKNRILNVSGMVLILVLMALMGFAAYFNGIGMKIRARSYEASVLRAVGTPVSALRKRLLLNSIKIPVIASALSYGLVKFAQLFMYKVYDYYLQYWLFLNHQGGGYIEGLGNGRDHRSDLGDFLAEHVFINRNMWQANAEIPALILFAVICAVTFVLTLIALKKFKRNIAGDLNEGRKRQ